MLGVLLHLALVLAKSRGNTGLELLSFQQNRIGENDFSLNLYTAVCQAVGERSFLMVINAAG